jgi:hypothetical protein
LIKPANSEHGALLADYNHEEPGNNNQGQKSRHGKEKDFTTTRDREIGEEKIQEQETRDGTNTHGKIAPRSQIAARRRQEQNSNEKEKKSRTTPPARLYARPS